MLDTESLWLLQGRTAMHSAASQNGSKLRDHEYEALCQKCRQTMPSDMIERWDGRFQYQELHPVNLHYQHTVDTLKAHCADVSAQDDEVYIPVISLCPALLLAQAAVCGP